MDVDEETGINTELIINQISYLRIMIYVGRYIF